MGHWADIAKWVIIKCAAGCIGPPTTQWRHITVWQRSTARYSLKIWIPRPSHRTEHTCLAPASANGPPRRNPQLVLGKWQIYYESLVSMKFAGGNYYQEQAKSLHFGRNRNRNKGTARIWQNIQIDVNRYCRDCEQVLTPSERIHKFNTQTTADAIANTHSR